MKTKTKIKIRKLISVIVVCVITVLSFTTTAASASMSAYWCSFDKRTGCIHCDGHSLLYTSMVTRADCTQPSGQVFYCSCGKIFYSVQPTPHSYNSNKVCTNSVSCGKVDTTNNSHFQYYMYRKGNFANYISTGWLSYGGHYAIDITNGSGTSINGFPVYAQGNGTVIKKVDTMSSVAGWYVAITYDNGYTARYLHLSSKSDLSESQRVNSQTLIGYTGKTGTAEYHLHYDINTTGQCFGDYINSSNAVNPTTLFPLGTLKGEIS